MAASTSLLTAIPSDRPASFASHIRPGHDQKAFPSTKPLRTGDEMDSRSEASNDQNLTTLVALLTRTPQWIGSYSIVYRGILRSSGVKEIVAVKIIRSVGDLRTMRRKVLRERMVWASLKHPNILPFYGHADDPDFEPFGAFISPWYSNGDAGQFLEKHGSSLYPAQRLSLWEGVVNGVAFLHACQPVIVHGDLKPGNIVIDDEYQPRICDFGLARIMQEESTGGMTTTTEHTGTERYLAPELITQTLATPAQASDVYALGCLGLEILFSMKPYAHRLNNHYGCIIMDIRDGIPPATPETVPDIIWDPNWAVVSACWNREPENRPTSGQILDFIRDTEGSSSPLSIHSPSSESSGQSIHEIPSGCNSSYSLHTGLPNYPLSSTIYGSSLAGGDLDSSGLPSLGRARAIQEYDGHDDELSVERGEILEIFENSTTWWKARKADGSSGVVPSMYLVMISPQEELPGDDESVSSEGESPVLFRAKASRDYVASDDDPSELSFGRGDVFDVIEKSGEWWHARRADGIYGNIPAKFLVTI